MPTSATFKYRGPDKRCPFPFNRDAAVAPSSSYDYVTLTASGGDAGLSEACRLWWLIHTVTFSPVGTFDDYPFYNAPYTGPAKGDPVDRISSTDPLMYFMGDDFAYDSYGVNMYISFVSSEWRLYYYFIISVLNEFALQGVIVNPAFGTNTVSGTFSLFGYTLSYEVVPETGVVADGVELTASSTFYTLV